jgi:hypothetical protein
MIGLPLCFALLTAIVPNGLVSISMANPQTAWPIADSLRIRRPGIAPAFNLDFRTSFLQHQRVNVWGINAGLEFGAKRHQLTLGYYWLSYATNARLITWQRNAARRVNLAYYTRTDLWFSSLQYWHVLVNSQRWLISLPLEAGVGVASALPQNVQTNVPIGPTQRDFFVPLQAGAYAQWKATRWAGLSTQVGYRYSVFGTDINQNFNGVYYSVGATLYPAFATDLWGWLRKRNRISPLHPPQKRAVTGGQNETE